jgi:hypothetical protein
MSPRWAPVLGFGVVAAIAFLVLQSAAETSAKDIMDVFEANEALTQGAPQQAVAASWAIRDAELEQVRQNGTRNGLLGICAAMLVSIAVNTALRERREAAKEQGPRSPEGPQGPPPIPPASAVA